MLNLSTAERLALLKLARATAPMQDPGTLSPIEPVDRSGPLPLSFAQQRLWFLEQLGSAGAAYHISTRLRLTGELDRAALVRALDRIVARHEALRTTFHAVDGEPVQRIAPAGESPFHLVEHDLASRPDAARELRRLLAEETGASFDLERGPLIRGRLVRRAEDDHVLLVTLHHIVSDGWSMGIFSRELSALYAAFRAGEPDPLAPLPVQYADYAVWQRRWVDGEVLKVQAEYWQTTLAGAPELLELPTDRARPARQDFAAATAGLVLDEALTAGLKTLSQRHGTTLFVTLLAGWATVLARLSGQEDVVVGTPTANRGRSEIEGLIGFFVNTLALRVDLSGSPSVADVLGRVKKRSLGAQQNQDIPFEQVVERVQPVRSLSHTPLFQVMFAWQNAPERMLELPGVALATLGPASSWSGPEPQVTATFDLSLDLSERGGRIVGAMEYATALFERETVERWLGYLRRALEEMVVDEGQRVERLALVSERERSRVLEAWNGAESADLGESCVHELFEQQVEHAPGAAALVFQEGQLTYAELNAAANRVARRLRAAGVGPEARVGVMLERGVEMVVALLAVLKAGGAYLPLDPALPAARRAALLADAGAAVLVTRAPGLAGFTGTVVSPAEAEGEDGDDLRLALPPAALAYVIYTSGSTGAPKGVGVAHAQAAAHFRATAAVSGLTPADRVLQVAAVGFDVSLEELLAPLCAGACVVLRGNEVPTPLELARQAAEQGTTVINPPTAYWHQLVSEPAALELLARTVRLVFTGGEAMSPAAARDWAAGPAAGVRLLNGYGPTETVVTCTAYDVPASLPDGAVHVPVGRPLPGRTAYVLDGWMHPAPLGAHGELCIGGILARGYLGRPAATAEVFVPDPFSPAPGARMYRTGDRARWSADGNLTFLGRTDHQVKIRGFRIELGEIEARLRGHPTVREAVVLAREDTPGETRLVAYVVGEETAGAEVLRAYLGETLPEFMVPAAYVRLEQLPLTPNGKLDRRALPAPEGDAFAARAYQAPLGETEAALAEIWSELLGIERVGRHDHFFALGGHSLLAVRVVSRVRQALGVEAAIGDLFLRPVLADFARGLETASRAELPAIESAARGADLPLSFAQQRLWFLDRMEAAGAAYHIPTRLRLKGELDRAALVRALDRIVARHEALRTTFPETDGVPAQRIAPAVESPFHLVEHDLSGQADAKAELGRVMAEEAGAPFDLARGPLIRGRLIRMAEDDHVLLVTMHHIVSDGWSMGVFSRELGALYAAFRAGEPDPLPPLPVQYADYAAWQRRWVDGEVLKAQAEYWEETLAGAPELLELPTDRARPARQDFTGAGIALVLDEELTAGLKALGARHGTTLFMTLLAGWAAVLSRLSGQEDVVVGTPTANRGRSEIEGLIGFFVNTLALRVDFSGEPSVSDVLGRVKERSLGAQQNQDIPFEQVVERVQPVRSLAHTPLFQVMFAWQNAPGGGLELPGLALAPLGTGSRSGSRSGPEPQTTAKFDLSLTLWEQGGRIVGSVGYATALFERETVERHLAYLRRVLEEMVADERQGVARLPLLPEAECRRMVEEWNAAGGGHPARACVHELFEAQAARVPDAVAVIHDGERMTYAELDARANRLAHHLRKRGVGPEVAVGVCLESRPELIVALLATFKAGGVYVPLDPALPAERLAYVAEDAGLRALVTRDALAGVPCQVTVRVDADAERIAAEPGDAPASGVHPSNLAYLIYTSGSTGRPKGVAVEHGAAAAHLSSMLQARGIVPEDTVLQFASASFDVSLEQVFVALLAGATLVLRGEELWSVREFRERARSLGITVANLPPAYWQEMSAGAGDERALPGVRLLLVGGDALPASAAHAGGATQLVNCYGPTEAVITATAFEVPEGFAGSLVPIGRPLPGHAAYVLDSFGGLVPPGVAGELYLGGGLLARGYLGRLGLTAERFVADPFAGEPGARMYRTGDRARWSADGNLTFLGRTDFQVKIRGFRIELGEIEARLSEHPGVRDAVVLAREEASGDRRLVAYYAGEALEGEALRAHLSERLPEYMVPAAYVRLEALPLTPSGKVDRKALPAPEAGAYAVRGYEAPLTEIEVALSDIWSEVLRVERVGRWDHFFELGGHSLRAVQVVSRVRQALGVEAAIGDLFLRPVLADFARGLETASRAELPAIESAARGADLPLSFAQQRLWFLDRMEAAGAAYHIPMRLRLKGELDRAALVRALDRIVARHEALRTTFPETDGVPAQRIAPAVESPFHLVEHDLAGRPDAARELRRLLAEEAGAPFDLARGPLIRGRLTRMAKDDHVLLVTMHHIVSDGWSMGIFSRELSTLYAAFRAGEPDPLPALPIQYADYAARQRRWVDGEVLKAQAEYWEATLAGAPEMLELPTDRARPARQDFTGAGIALVLDEELTAGLKALGARHGTTLFMTLLAGWATVLSRLSGQEDVVVGTPTANRGRSEIEGLIGFFVNTLALRVDFSGEPSVADVLGRVKERSLGAQQNQDIPFEQVVERVQPVRSLAHTPLFQVTFAWQNAPGGGLELPGLALAPLGTSGSASPATAKFDLSLTLWEQGGRIVGSITYATALFERTTVERHAGYLRRALETMAADERLAVGVLPLLSGAERRRVLEEFNHTRREYPREACVHELFEAQAARAPDAVAVVCGDERLTYAQLNARANRLAHHLRGLGVGPDARVGICVERSPEMITGLLAILKAGGAYVPLDPAYPAERLRYMLEDSAPVALLTQSSLAGTFGGLDVPAVELDAPAPAWAEGPEANPEHAGPRPGHLAYVIYTSGSTGRPKGVMVEHRSLVNHTAWQAAAFGLGANDTVLQRTSISFDASVWELWTTLAVGARMVLLPVHASKDPGAIARVVEESGATIVQFVPTLLQAVLRGLPEGASLRPRILFCGGEPLPESLVAEARARGAGEVVNLYGPTEVTIHATSCRCADDGRAPGIGAPVGNARVYILDGAGEPVPVGVVGELHVGGAGVARGYLDRPAVTAERFVADPWGEPGARRYRTGDLGRWRPDGTIEFLGRADFQVKVRGFRIELGEIEARLLEHPAVRAAVVLAREDATGDRRLVAYYAGDAAVGVETLRAHLSEHLPEHMVPAAYVRPEAFPVTPNGKVDRRALPAPEGDAFATRAYEAPLGEIEEVLAGIWSELLGVERVGRWDDFFALGGHSLLAVRVVSRVRQTLGVEAPLGDVFLRPVLADFARGLETASRAELPAIESAARGADLPLSFAQQRLWFLDRMEPAGAAYHIPTRLRLKGELDRAALVRALDRIVARHEALRTSFPETDGVPAQRIAPAEASPFHLVEYDLRGAPEAALELRRITAEETDAPFNLARGPLIRGRLVRMAEDGHVLLVTMHHIVSDGWSMGIFSRELSALYAAFRAGEPDPLPPLPVQYADYAAWQRRWVDGEVLKAQAEYWEESLAGAPELLELPTDRARPAGQDFSGGVVDIELDAALTAGLKALGARHGTTLFMTLLAGWATVLSRLSGQEDVVVGTPTANRGRSEIEGLIGFFVNTLALRVNFSGSPSVSDVLGRVRERSLGAQQNQDIPFEQVVELVQPVRSLAHTPLFQVMFTLQNAPGDTLELPGLTLGPGASRSRGARGSTAGPASQVTALFDLSLTLFERDGKIAGGVEYATALFERETVERHLAYLRRVLEAMAADERQGVARLPLLSGEERRTLVEDWGRTGAIDPGEGGVHQWFEEHARRAPGAVAVVDDGRELSYGELNARANRLARHLVSLGVGPDARVAVCAERSPELVAALLAVLKAGGAYVPVDPAHPGERFRYVLDDCAPVAVLAQAPLAARFADASVPVVRIDDDAAWAAGPADDLARMASPQQAAYVIYTSGSTGKPKGVVVAHRSVRQQVAALRAEFGLRPDDRFLHFASFTFDTSVDEIFGALCSGAALVLRSDAWLEGAGAFWALCERHGVTVCDLPTRFWQLLAADGEARIPARVRVLGIGGEAVDAASAEAWSRRAGHRPRLVNGYGPTEATVTATVREVGDDPAAWRSIGRPIVGTRAYLADARGELVPIGVVGEILLGGGQVARGYLGRPALTAERFVPDPFGGEPGARLYRTGDLGRWRGDGGIEFAGRSDFQVKIRGFRIELGEIEARLLEHAGVREAVVIAREDAPGDRRPVAYVSGDAPDAEALRTHLSQRLPEYMVPAAYVRLDAFPLTPSGKVDRKALPAPEAGAYAVRGYEAPLTEIEVALSDIWSDVMDVERVGRWDHFFELGGHSLLAVQVVSRVRQVLDIEVALGDLFLRPVLADFARGLEQATRAQLPPIVPAERGDRLELSFAQQRLWFLEQMGSTGAAYHIPTRLRLKGELDRDALVRALDRIVARHEALRTTFAQTDGVPSQRIAPADDSPFHLVERDLRGAAGAGAELRRLTAEETDAPFDLERGPLIRGRLIRIGDDDHVLFITMHHIVSDGWSMGVFTRELGVLYAAFRDGEPDPLPPLPIQYADYAVWQRRWVDGEVLEAQAEYWKETLSGVPELLELPADHVRPARVDHAGALLGVELDDALTAGLKALGRRHGTTLFMTLLAGWATVLSRLSGQEDVVVGTPTANRGRQEIEGLIGFFVNMLPVRVELSGAPSVSELLARVKERALGAQHHQDIPFEQVVELVQPERSLAHAPLFQAMFTWQNAAGGDPELSGLTLAPVGSARASGSAGSAGAAAHVRATVDLSLTLWERGGGIAGSVTYATALFERETVERWLGYLRRALEEMAADESRGVERLALVPESERRLVLEEWNRTESADLGESCIHELFEVQVERAPGAAALVFQGEPLTYAALNAAANRVARRLRAAGVGPEGRVGVMLERGVEMVVALLAVLKAGGAYLPLDPALPAARRAALLADAGAAVLVTHTPGLEGFTGTVVCPAEAEGEDGGDLRLALPPAALAYVIYTSGSTGAPKGVGVAHAQAAAHCRAAAAVYGLTPADRVLQFAAAGFDVSLEQLLAPLCAGACVVLRGNEVPTPLELARQAAEQGMTVVNPPTAYWHQLVSEPAALELLARTVRLVIAGGEAMSPAAVRDWSAGPAAGVRLLNGYGPTETVVTCTAYDVPASLPDGAVHVPVGRPLPGRVAYVVDGRMRPAPLGVHGELCIGGILARGYLGRPAATAEAFVPNPFSPAPGARMYRTGDRARWLAAGELEFLGRRDHQVKVRGFRIEPGEIEARLRGHPTVREAVVLAREDAPGETRLVAYVVGEETAGADVLRAYLGETLPAYMVPAAYVRLEQLPLTPNGKLDRGALLAPEGDAYAPREYEAPVGEIEVALAEIWSDLLGVERVGRRDNLFALGGHSLLAVRVVSRIRQTLGADAALGDLFLRPVLADFARGLETASRAELPAIKSAARGADLPLSFAQQRLWFLDRMEAAGVGYHIPVRLWLKGELDRAALVRALNRIVARHEALRTTFPETDGVPAQWIAPAGESPFHLVEHDLASRPDAAGELRRLLAEEAGAPFDLARGPLIRGRLVRRAEDDHVLLVTMHHVVSDGWSMGIFTRELGALYAAFRAGEPDPLPPLAVQYADYAAWQRRWVYGEVLKAQAEYWEATLAGAPELLELPTDRARPARQDFSGGVVEIELDAALTAGLKALGARHGTTLFMTLLAGWATVLSRLSGQEDVVVGTPTANRGRSEIEGLIGFFVNTLALRVDLSGSPSVSDVLGRVKERALGARHHQDIPFEQVVERVQPARSLSHTPLFQVMFASQNAPEREMELPGLALAPLGTAGLASQVTATFDLSLALSERGGRIVGAVEYAAALFERPTVERWLGCLRRVLAQMAADDARPVDELELLSDGEWRRVVEEWNATEAGYPRWARVHDLFAAQVARTPDAVALSWRGERLTYAELDARANRLAHHLRKRGVGPDARVGICLERTPDLVAALLAVLKAGGAYVPLDPAYPAERLGYMVADAEVRLVVTGSSLAGRLPDGPERLVWDREADAVAREPATAPESGTTPENLSHVIFTSGSTGRPKGVMIRHSSVVVLLHWLRENVTDEERSSVLFSTSINFDVSVAEIFGTLAWGGKLVIAENALELATLDEEVVHASMVPSAAAELLRSGGIPACVKTLNLGGEALPNALAQGLHALGTVEKVGNLYGPTEDTTYSTCSLVPRGAEQVLIGTPVANTRAYVLDRHLQPVPIGVVGELYLAGDGLSRGYANRPAMTAERFVPCPFGPPGARMYRVRDRVRRRADGELEYLGRTDFQVKVRGYRIELGEIEARLAEHPGVRAPVVLVREDAPGDRRLVAYYLADEAIAVDALQAHLADRLPGYMVPAAYMWMEAYPLTPNGKVDRKALPGPAGDAYRAREYEAPVGDAEQALAGIWAEVLRVARVGRHDDFFELGGHSLLAVQVIPRIRQELEAEVTLAQIFAHPTVESLAALLGGSERPVRDDRAIALGPAGSQPPLFLVYDGMGMTTYAQVLHPHIGGDIPVYALPAPSFSETPLRTVEGMATRLARMIREVRPSGPYRVAGWSFGGILAYEIASQLIGQDEIVEFVGMVDSEFPVHPSAASREAAHEHELLLPMLRMGETTEDGERMEAEENVGPGGVDLEVMVNRMREEGRLPAHITVKEILEMRARRRRHVRALLEYRPQPIPVAVHLFPSRESSDPDLSRGWQALLPERQLQVTPVPGTHRSVMRAPNTVTLGGALTRRINHAREGGKTLPGEGDSPVLKLQHGKAGVAPLFCVPGGGTSVATFIDLIGSVDSSWPVYGLQPRGMDGTTVPHSTVPAAAEYYLRAVHEACPEGPIHLLGHSFGGWVAFELALRLREAGRPIGSLTILDSEVPGESEVRREFDGREIFLQLVEVLELTAERSFGIGSPEVDSRDEVGRLKLLHQKMVQFGLLNARSTYEALYGPFRTFARCVRATYRPAGAYPDRLRLVLVNDPRTDEDTNLEQFAEAVRGWKRWAPSLVCSTGAGNHNTALKSPHVATLARYLADDRK